MTRHNPWGIIAMHLATFSLIRKSLLGGMVCYCMCL